MTVRTTNGSRIALRRSCDHKLSHALRACDDATNANPPVQRLLTAAMDAASLMQRLVKHTDHDPPPVYHLSGGVSLTKRLDLAGPAFSLFCIRATSRVVLTRAGRNWPSFLAFCTIKVRRIASKPLRVAGLVNKPHLGRGRADYTSAAALPS